MWYLRLFGEPALCESALDQSIDHHIADRAVDFRRQGNNGTIQPGRITKLRQLDPSTFCADAQDSKPMQFDRDAADLNLDRGQRKEPAGAYRRDRKHTVRLTVLGLT
jgi:hypothetical protein